MCDLPSLDSKSTFEDSIPTESLFLISSSDPWYGDFLIYLLTHTFYSNTSRSEKRRICCQPEITSSSVIPFIVVVLIRSYEGASHLRMPRKSLMNATRGHVVEIYLIIMLPSRKFYVLVTSCLPSFATASSLFRSVMHARYMILNPVLRPLHCIPLLLVILLRNVVSTL